MSIPYFVIALLCGMAPLRAASAEAKLPERFITIDNAGLWPKLVLLKNDCIVAVAFDQPSHGRMEGAQQAWISCDGGRCWKKAGAPAPSDPGTVRMGISVGQAHDDSLLVLASGWGDVNNDPKIRPMLQPWVCRSKDGGETWTHANAVMQYPAGVDVMRPWGLLIPMPGNMLATTFYHSWRTAAGRLEGTSYMLFSSDNGRTWKDAAVIGPKDYNETVAMRLRADRWLAAARGFKAGNLDLFTSDDEGRTWKFANALTGPQEHPGNLLRLRDGRILLTYGIRRKNLYGIGVRTSRDEGRTWDAPRTLLKLDGTTDGGYPSTVQLASGTLVTVYYSNGVSAHQRYHMGVYRWSAEELDAR